MVLRMFCTCALQVYADVCIGLFSLDVGIKICEVPSNPTSDIATVHVMFSKHL